MSLRIQIKSAGENQPVCGQIFSTSPEKKERAFPLRTTEKNMFTMAPAVAEASNPFKPLTASDFYPIAMPSEQQLTTSAKNIFEKAMKTFAQEGPNEDSIQLCEKALKIPFMDSDLRWEGLSLLARLYEKAARSSVARRDDLDCAIKIQENMLEMDYHYTPIAKAKLQYMLARNVMSKALREHDLSGVNRTITIIEGILSQDCLNDFQRVGLERNLAKAYRARSLFEPKEDQWLTYLS